MATWRGKYESLSEFRGLKIKTPSQIIYSELANKRLEYETYNSRLAGCFLQCMMNYNKSSSSPSSGGLLDSV